jgi:hypothetical protein
MGLQRLGISNPAANTSATIFTATNQYLMSVIATNISASSSTIRVWVEPSGASASAQYAYIVYDLPIDGQNSYETFRFAINQNDTVRVRASSASVSFQAYGLVQFDVNLGVGISSFQSASPTTVVDGLIWVDSDGVLSGSSAKPAYVWSSASASWIPFAGTIDTSANYNFTGNIEATTQVAGTSNTRVATTAFVTNNFEKSIPLSASAPSSPASSDLWVDSSGTAPILKVYNGTSWISLASPADDDQIILSTRMFA